MSGSSNRINYNLRPAKHIERKMICDAFRRLSEFGAVEAYRYVGLGSFYFRDFSLIHRLLNITSMISIEREVAEADRYRFNVPFKCVELCFGQSNAILPTLTWEERTIAWLDYDGELDASILTDVSFLCSSVVPGSVVLFSMNVNATRGVRNPREVLANELGEANIPGNVTDADFIEWGKAAICRRIVNNKIEETLASRNGTRGSNNKLIYKQLFNFRYKDGAMMLTVGGLIHEVSQGGLVAKAAFQDLQFVRFGEDPYEISVPMLTYKELGYLNAHLPSEDIEIIDRRAIPFEDVRQYGRVYRYFPHFADAEF